MLGGWVVNREHLFSSGFPFAGRRAFRREKGVDPFCGRFLIAPTVKAKPQPTDQQGEIKRPQLRRKGWPLRWIVLFILVYIAVYTYWRLK